MAKTSKVEFYLGTVVGIKNKGNLVGSDPAELLKNDSQYHECIIDIPGVVEGVKAFPRRGEIDEPKVGDLVFVTSMDPIYGSYYLFEKLQENDFVGFRAHGKMVDITHDYITIGVFDESSEYKDKERPDPSKSYVKMDASGNIDIMATENETVKISGNAEVEVSGNVTVKISGNADVKVSGKCNIDSPEVNITGGKLATPNGGNALSNGMGGFCGIKSCLFSGAPHVTNEITGT